MHPVLHKSFLSADICLLEHLIPKMLAVEMWGDKMANSCMLVLTDNEALVKQTSKCERIIKLLRQFVLSCIYQNILFKDRHIAGKKKHCS